MTGRDKAAPLRADARRNRDAILDAALEVFAEEGIETQSQVIAERAGIGVGTLFRHFPTKDSLVEAVGLIQVGTIIERFDAALREPDPAGAFERLMWHFTGNHAQYRAVPRALRDDTSEQVDGLRTRLYEILDRAVRLAQEAGRIRADLQLVDVMLLMTACAHVADGTSKSDPALRKRFMTVVFSGMRPDTGVDLPRLSRSAHLDSWLAVYQVQHPDGGHRPRPAAGPLPF